MHQMTEVYKEFTTMAEATTRRGDGARAAHELHNLETTGFDSRPRNQFQNPPRGVTLASPIHPHTALESALSWAYLAEGYREDRDARAMAAQMAQMWAGIASAAIAWERA